MNPAVVLSHITVNTFKLTTAMGRLKLQSKLDYKVFSPYRISEVLTRYAHRGSSHADDHGGFVVQFEHDIVDVDFIKGKIF